MVFQQSTLTFITKSTKNFLTLLKHPAAPIIPHPPPQKKDPKSHENIRISFAVKSKDI